MSAELFFDSVMLNLFQHPVGCCKSEILKQVQDDSMTKLLSNGTIDSMDSPLINQIISWRLARRVFLFVVLVELISLATQPYPAVQNLAFALIIFLTLVIALKRLDLALWIALAELVVGSKGYLVAAA